METMVLTKKGKNENSDFAKDQGLFLSYVEKFLNNTETRDYHLRLKIEHTKRVFSLACKIASEEFTDPLLIRATALGALYHDIGRFQQFADYATFADAASINHGLLGSKIMGEEKFLASEDQEIARIIRTAVALHNRLTVPDGVKGDKRLVLDAVRDADKIDILYIMAKELGGDHEPDPIVLMFLKNEPRKYTEKILAGLSSDTRPTYVDMVYLNDFRLVLCSWLKDLNYASSFRLLKESGNLELIVAGLRSLPAVHKIAEDFLRAYHFGQGSLD